MSWSNEAIYTIVGTSRQAIHQFSRLKRQRAQYTEQAERALLLHRRSHPGLGLVKAYHQIAPMGIGRDRFLHEMTRRGHGLRLKRSYHRVTRSGRYRFPNLIKGLLINDINLVWQSDTTYFRVAEKWYYLTFIIDVYSRRIVGYAVSDRLAATANVGALRRAFDCRNKTDLSALIFHSDGGTQYLSRPFTRLLGSRGVSSSMCTTALNNAYAEKLNDVMKGEYLAMQNVRSFDQLKRLVARNIQNYNATRHHGQLPNRTSPLEYEGSLKDISWAERPMLLIKDGQSDDPGINEKYCGPNFAFPTVLAPRGVSQILPAHVIFDQEIEKSQLSLRLR